MALAHSGWHRLLGCADWRGRSSRHCLVPRRNVAGSDSQPAIPTCRAVVLAIRLACSRPWTFSGIGLVAVCIRSRRFGLPHPPVNLRCTPLKDRAGGCQPATRVVSTGATMAGQHPPYCAATRRAAFNPPSVAFSKVGRWRVKTRPTCACACVAIRLRGSPA